MHLIRLLYYMKTLNLKDYISLFLCLCVYVNGYCGRFPYIRFENIYGNYSFLIFWSHILSCLQRLSQQKLQTIH